MFDDSKIQSENYTSKLKSYKNLIIKIIGYIKSMTLQINTYFSKGKLKKIFSK